MRPIILLAILAVGLYGCQKKNETPADPANVGINITSPGTGQLFHNGDSVSINAEVTYTGELHGYELKIIDTSTGFVVYDKTEHGHDDHFHIHEAWTDSVTQQTWLKLSLVVAIDHEGTTAQKELYFQYQP